MYFKITNARENHNNFQYTDGLNILEEKFNDDPYQSCCAGGFYFSDAKNIFKFLSYGIYLREITLPSEDPNFKMIKDPQGDKWRANMVVLGKRYDLFSVDTFKFLLEKGADIHADNDYALQYSARCGYLDIVKFLIEEKGADVHANYNKAIRSSIKYNHLNVVKYIIKEGGGNIHANNDEAFILSIEYNHFDIIKFLLESGANIHAQNDYALYISAENGYSERFSI